MFNVRVYKNIWNMGKAEVDDILNNQNLRIKEIESTSYFFDTTLEFPPFLNLDLSSEGWRGGMIKRISWDIDEKRFYCYMEDEYPHPGDHAVPYLALDFDEAYLKDKCLRDGWKLLTLADG